MGARTTTIYFAREKPDGTRELAVVIIEEPATTERAQGQSKNAIAIPSLRKVAA
jgi:hypothetical protein